MFHEEIADVLGNGMEAGLVDLEDERDVVLEALQDTLEVRHGNTGMRMPDVQADEIARIRIQAVDGRPPATGRSGFAQFDHEAFVHQFADELGHRRDAGVDFFAQGGDAVFAILDAKTQDGLFQDGILVVFFV